MKKKWLIVSLASTAFLSCEKKEEQTIPTLPTAEKKVAGPTKIEPIVETSPNTSAPSAAVTPDPAKGSAQKAPGETGDNVTPAAPNDGIPTAKPIEGQPGFVFSPYNDKVVDVRGMPSGMLVADPTFPASEKKHFRVP